MADIDPVYLFGKLNRLSRKSIEGTMTFCKLRNNPKVELIHFLFQLFNEADSDLHRIIQHFELDVSRLSAHLQRSLDLLPRGASSLSGFAQPLLETVEQGWVYGSLMFKQGNVRTGHLLVGILKTPHLTDHFLAYSNEFRKIDVRVLADEFSKITAGSPEDDMVEAVGGGVAPGVASGAMKGAGPAGSALAQFAVDLTQRARDGEIDPILGRDEEIRQIVDILMRRRQNNPILTGEAGVGKTAVVEGFALRIASGDVPPALREVSLCSLDLGLLQAGASMKGEFEERLKKVIEEVQASPKPIILFIDEAHTLIGAGGQAGQNDAANLLKPALARGTLRTIAATTWAEYKKYFEKDPALTRRFQVIKVDEPDEEKAVRMIRGLAPILEKHHKVPVLDSALEAAARLSGRYIPSRQLPDKAVSLIDTACARVAISQHATPAEIEDCTRLIEVLKTEFDILGKEESIGLNHSKRKADLTATLSDEEERLKGLNTRWEGEKALVQKLLAARLELQTADDKPKDGLLAQCLQIEKDLASMQGESPLVFPHVDEQAVAAVISDWTGIPAGRMVKNEIEQTLNLADILERRVIGQRHALETIARRVQTSRARLDNPNRPIGVFMLAGPSGTGKTETALTLAETLFGDESSLISINMSEFQESHTVSTLKGAPPGYVGYGEGGKLTEAVRRRPYSVILLDEVEKAHSDVHEIFFQVFDKGWMEDGEGRFIDFKNTLIILTSNAAQTVITTLCKDPDLKPNAEDLEKAMRGPLTKIFPDALLNRLVVVPYYPISQDMLRTIITLNLRKVEKRVRENHGIPFIYGDDVVDLIAQRCTELERGARLVDSIVTNQLLPEIGREFLTRMVEGRPLEKITVKAKDGEFALEF